MDEVQKSPVAAPVPAPKADAPADKFVVLLADMPINETHYFGGKCLKLPAGDGDALIAAKKARLASATDIAIGA